MNATEKITEYIQKNTDWKGELVSEIRQVILETVPAIEEEWKWNSPVWAYQGLVCSVSAFKKHVSLTFFRGSELEEYTDLFNSPTGSKNTRSIIFKEGNTFNKPKLASLLKKAVQINTNQP
jgi:hypothetical protein